MQSHICCWSLEVLEASCSVLKDKLEYPLFLTLQLLVNDEGSSVDGGSSNESTEASLACTELEVDTLAEASSNPKVICKHY